MARDTRSGRAGGADLEGVWRLLDGQVASGRYPGYVAAVRLRGEVSIRAGGRAAVETGSVPMGADTRFRIASITKVVGGVLALSLVQDGVLDLDDPIARWLPEAANPRVLTAPGAPLDRTVPARRPITVRHLLTLTSGWGGILEPTPLQTAMMERRVYPGPLAPPMSGDEFVAAVAGLPLAFQPGEGWLYDTGIDLLGVLLVRATGRSLSDLLAEHVTGPLGMAETAFWTPDTDRLATAYRPGPDGLELLDPPDGIVASPPSFEELGSGLVSTAPDVLRFFCAMADGGAPVLRADSVRLMTTDALTDTQRRQARPIVGPGRSWGLATAVDLEAAEPWMAPGRWGWDGGTGTTARVDPTRDIVGVLLTQRAMTSPQDGFDDFWAAVAAAT
jgi:CubicO group peptidase (beta-lactamase class C family)